MGENVIILEITSGICCILTAVFLHFSAIPRNTLIPQHYYKIFFLST